MGSFIYVPVIALLCYTFMSLPFLASKRNRLINSFLFMMLLLIFWTGGSFLMRMRAWPSVKAWYDFSLFGLTMFPCGVLFFIYDYIGREDRKPIIYSAFIMIAANLINIKTGFFLASPQVVSMTNGDVTFVYHPTWAVSILFAMTILLTLKSALVVIKENNGSSTVKFFPIIAGIAALALGNFLIMLPAFRGIPLDIASGVIYATCLFYALYRKNLFRLTLLISRSNCYALAAIISLGLLANFFPKLENTVKTQFPALHSIDIIIALIFTAAIQIIYQLLKSFIDHIFVKDETIKAEQLKKFSTAVSKTLVIDEVLQELINIIQDTISTKKVYICISDPEGEFKVAGCSSCLDEKSLVFKNDNPVVQWLTENSECLIIKDFRHTINYKSMWEMEKNQIQRLGIDCIIPLKGDGLLVGMILLSQEKKTLSQDDMNFLTSIGAIASIAVKNSMLYEKARIEARTDELTGVLNRKYFYEMLSSEYEKNRSSCLTLIILNIDDFKLYNQLYGNKEGDLALQKIAKIITACTGNRGYVGRYSGKEFAVILPMVDVLAAKNLALNIKDQIQEMNKGSTDFLKPLTVSIGICSVPFGASTLSQLLNNVDMSVYQVKCHGKNGIMIYSAGQAAEAGAKQDRLAWKENVYSGYASTIYALTAAIDAKDHYTFNHSKNVEYYSTCMAMALNLNEDLVEIIREAALLHDVGKIGVPEKILNKLGKLTSEEYEIIKGHVESSISIIRHLPSLDYVIPAVLGHHERYDGKGYPRRIAGEDIPLLARILCIADSFDAMLSVRSYKEAFSVGFALQELKKQAGKQFDPKLADLFVELVKTGRISPGESTAQNDGLQKII
ncbi:MAG: diguanylate cyclase [Bacillota bacterium]|nr:diguanylate cyclase [Bacillota bacterium]